MLPLTQRKEKKNKHYHMKLGGIASSWPRPVRKKGHQSLSPSAVQPFSKRVKHVAVGKCDGSNVCQ